MTLLLILVLALVGVVTGFALGQRMGRATGWVLSAGLLGLAALLVVVWRGRGAGAVSESYVWLPALDVSLRLRLDALGLVFGLVVCLVGALVMAYAVTYLPKGRHGVFYALLTFFAAAMLGLVLADDLIVLWVMWELTTLCSFFLIEQAGPKGQAPAIRTLIVTAGGGLSLLAAVMLTIVFTGTSTLSEALVSPVWTERPVVAAVVATLVAVAAFTKCAQFPFHGWLPDAMVASTPVSAYLHAAAMVKAGIFLLLRFSTAFHDVPVWNLLLVTVGLGTALMGAVYALQRFDLKELLAYSTISQLGFLVATIGVGTDYAIVGALVHVVAHAVFKSALFMAVGLIDHETGTRDLRELSGLRRAMPVTSLILLAAAASMAGLPPLLGFVSKEAMFKAFAESPFPTVVTVGICTVAVAAATCTVAYSARMLRPLAGPARGSTLYDGPPREAPTAMWAPVLMASVAGVVLGLFGPLLEPLVDQASNAVMAESELPDLSLWHGLNPALLMSVAALALGGLLVIWRRRVDRLLVGAVLGPVRAVTVVEGFRTGSITLGSRVGALTHRDSPAQHLALPLLVSVVVTATVAVLHGVPAVPSGVGRGLDWLLLALVVVGLSVTVHSRSRVALVTTVGIVGFAVALTFFSLGATDVAITQLLVEILTVVIMMLLLVRLPGGFHPTSRVRVAWATGVAVLAGSAATVWALLTLATPDLSPVGEDYLARAYELSGGTNVVNTILVDFRALDTLGEMVVLGVAAIAVLVTLESRGLLPHQPTPLVIGKDNPALDPSDNTAALRVTDRLVVPVLLALSLWLFLRGHYQPGGGFIGALVAGSALALIFLAAEDDSVARLRLDYTRLVGAGIVIAVCAGLLGLTDGSFLRPLYAEVLGLTLSTGLVFDVGVYLTVLGLVLGAISRLGLDGPEANPLRRPRPEQVDR